MVMIRRRVDPKNPPKFSAEELARLDAMTAEEIERNAAADSDNPPLTEDEAARIASARRVQAARAAAGLSQVAFARKFHINLGRLRDWEQGRFQPDSVALAYLRVIEANPVAVERALEES